MFKAHPLQRIRASIPFSFILLLLAGLVLRFILGAEFFGYQNDIKSFMAWADQAYRSFSHIYDRGMFLDYPPGYVYVLTLLGAVRNLLGISWDTHTGLLLLKLVPILADAATSVIIYRMSSKSFSKWTSIGLSAAYLFNPATVLNSAVWGQVDAFFMLFIFGYLYLLTQGKLSKSAAMLAIALLIKPQALLFGPFLLIRLIQRKNLKASLSAVSSGIGAFILGALPFCISNGFVWLPKLYFNTLSSYPYASLNAFNVMTLFRGNWVPTTDGVYGAFGTLALAAIFLYAWYLYGRSMNRTEAAYVISFIFLAAVFTFSAKMHERYLFYALLPALIGYLQSKDRRLLLLFAGFSLTHAINVAYVLYESSFERYFISNNNILMIVVSAVNVGLVAYAVKIGWELYGKSVNSSTLLESKATVAWADRKNNGKPRFLSSFDIKAILVMCLLYSSLALYHLGSFKAPETFWKPEVKGVSVVIDLGTTASIQRAESFVGAGTGDYTYWFSDDGESWRDPLAVKSDHTKVFTWNVQEPKKSARYVKLTVDAAGFAMHEVAFFDGISTTPLHIRNIRPDTTADNSAQADKGGMHNVIDEQKIVPSNPSYMDGTYFDEIYHARTAYEHLHKIEPYENTHPPLGKLLISLGIAIFGMNPFGWRIVGTLFGVAMIPLMYVFGKRVFGSSRYGFISSLLFTLDFMHFAQTRIATIDVYGVFFIMLMFYYMYRYFTTSFYEVQLRKTLVPLMLSGLFFGIGVASKWIVLYGGSGLAILFFWSLLQRYREYRGAKRLLRENALAALELQMQDKPAGPDSIAPVVTDMETQQSAFTEDFFMDKNDKAPENHEQAASEPLPRLKAREIARYEGIIAAFPRNALLTVLWCVLWFILIPLVIYIASYIPFMMVDGPGHGIRNLWDYQVNMYNYHKNLVATHPFASKWYEWPVMVLPIWYYQGHFLPQDKVSSIVSFGNPLVWWPGILAVFGAVYMAFKTRNKQLTFLLIAFITQYAPWILITRLTFIYHYFAMVPFMILCLTYFIVHVMDKYPERKRWVYLFLAAAGVVFLMYYPILSGAVVNKYYTMYVLRWLPSWNYF